MDRKDRKENFQFFEEPYEFPLKRETKENVSYKI